MIDKVLSALFKASENMRSPLGNTSTKSNKNPLDWNKTWPPRRPGK